MSLNKRYFDTEEAQIGTPSTLLFNSNKVINVDKSSDMQQHGKEMFVSFMIPLHNLKVNNVTLSQLKCECKCVVKIGIPPNSDILQCA